MAQKLLILLFICIFFTGCVDENGQPIPGSPEGSIGENPEHEGPTGDDETAPAQEPSDPLSGLKPYDSSTFIDHRNKTAPVDPVDADYELCGAVADWNIGDDRYLWIKTGGGTYFRIEGQSFNYSFSHRVMNTGEEPYWRDYDCGQNEQPVVMDSGQCRITVNQWCSNFWDVSASYIEFEVKWYHYESTTQERQSGPFTILRQMQ